MKEVAEQAAEQAAAKRKRSKKKSKKQKPDAAEGFEACLAELGQKMTDAGMDGADYERQFLAALGVFDHQPVYRIVAGDLIDWRGKRALAGQHALEFEIAPLRRAVDPDSAMGGLFDRAVAPERVPTSDPTTTALGIKFIGAETHENEHPGAHIDFDAMPVARCPAAVLDSWLKARGYTLPAGARVDDVRSLVDRLLRYEEAHPVRARRRVRRGVVLPHRVRALVGARRRRSRARREALGVGAHLLRGPGRPESVRRRGGVRRVI